MAVKVEEATLVAAQARKAPSGRFSLRRLFPPLVVAALVLALLAEGVGLLQARGSYAAASEQLTLSRQSRARSASQAGQDDLALRRQALEAQLGQAAAALGTPPHDLVGAVLALAAESGLQVTALNAGQQSRQRFGTSQYSVQGFTVAGRAALDGWRRFLAQAEQGALGPVSLENGRIELQQGVAAGTVMFSVYSRPPEPGNTEKAAARSQTPESGLTQAWQRGGWEFTAFLLERALAGAPNDRDVRRLLVESYLAWGASLAAQGDSAGAARAFQLARKHAQLDNELLQRVETLALPEKTLR